MGKTEGSMRITRFALFPQVHDLKTRDHLGVLRLDISDLFLPIAKSASARRYFS